MHQFKRASKLRAQPGAERNACLCFRKEAYLWGSRWVTVMHFKSQAKNIQKGSPRLDGPVLHQHQLRGKEHLFITVCAQLALSFLPQQCNIIYLRAYLEIVALATKVNWLNCWNCLSQNIIVVHTFIRQHAFILSQNCSTHFFPPIQGNRGSNMKGIHY